jgi:hypothetical protein
MPDPARGQIGWGDALTAARRLGLTTPGDFDALVALLGLATQRERDAPDATAPAPGAIDVDEDSERSAPWTTRPVAEEEFRSPVDQRTVAEPLPDEPVDLIELTAEPPVEPAPASQITVPYEPPIPANQLRAALTMLLRRDRLSDDIDVEATVTLVAEQRPLDRPPRLIEQSTVRGATLIADTGPSMLPYLDDVTHFVSEAAQVVGESRLAVHWVQDGALPARPNAVDVTPPGTRPQLCHIDREPERPVLIVSTLGAVQPPAALPGAQARWQAIADAAQQSGADITALVPHRGHHWPPALRRAIRFVAWDDLADVGRGRA